MTLAPGTRLGSFEILDSLGAGGMGEVWRARDTTLQREVAIKVLPESVAARPERLGRFRREAQLLAALNHPNIASIYGIEEAHGTPALVLELVPGPTLADRIAQGPIPIGEALLIAKQIAEAIEAAHDHGIVHRDLKPSNIKVRRDGAVKVLDFGLAKALDPSFESAAADVATVTSPAVTVAGVIMGTAAYMSPEQARGDVADTRADIWAYGCVLFEMLTGTRVFDGRTVSDVIAAVLTSDPEWDRLPAALHPRIRLMLERCLERDARDRYHSISDARVDVQKAMATPSSGREAAPLRDRSATRRASVWIGLAVLLTAIVAAVAAWWAKPSSDVPLSRLSLVIPPDQAVTQTPRSVVTISPDGTSIVYVANDRLFLRRLDVLEASAIRGTEGAPSTPTFSPDGRSIAFWNVRRGQLERVPVEGGTPVRIAQVNAVYGLHWGVDDRIVYAEENGLWKVTATGGAAEHIVKIEPTQRVHGPQVLPDGSLLFTLLSRAQGAGSAAWDEAEIVMQTPDGKRVSLVRGSDGRYLSTGHLLFALDTVLFAVPFDLSSRTVRSRPTPVVAPLQRATRTPGSSAAANYAVSAQGTLVYLQAQSDGRGVLRSLVAVDREGRSEPLLDDQRAYWRPRVSPDGKLAAVEVFNQENEQLWIVDLASRTARPLAVESTLNIFAAWTPDSRSVVFRSNRNGVHGVYRQTIDGIEQAALLVRTPAEPIPTDISRDGVVVFSEGSQSGARAIKTIRDGVVADFLATPAMEHMAVFSPNGKWMAYVSNDSGRDEVYLRPFPRVEGLGRQISVDGGTAPVWARNGSELYFRSASGDQMVVPLADTPTLTIGRPQSLFRVSGRYRVSGNAAAYDVLADGRFIMVTEPERPVSNTPQITVVQNWFRELERLVP